MRVGGPSGPGGPGPQDFFGGRFPLQKGPQSLPFGLMAPSPEPPLGPNYLRGALLNMEQPLKSFPQEFLMSGGAGGATFSFKSGDASNVLPVVCKGFRVISVTGAVAVSVNGGGGRTVLDQDNYTGCEIASLDFSLAASATATLQAWGE